MFGDYIDVYDLTQAVDDGATVKVFYEPRLAKVDLSRPKPSPNWTRVRRRRVRHRGTRHAERHEDPLGAGGGRSSAPTSASSRARRRHRRRTGRPAAKCSPGKAMVVAMSRRIAAALYDEIVALRPDWHVR